MQFTIEVPEYQKDLHANFAKQLQDRGFNTSEANLWAAIACNEYSKRVGEVSEKIIELFGANLFHSFDNIKHFAEITKKYGNEFKINLLNKEFN